MKHKLKLFIGLALIIPFLVSCGKRVSVGQTEIGYVKGKNGIKNEPIQASTFRLPYVAPWGVPYNLIVVDTSRFVANERLELFMPKDDLQMKFEIRGIYGVPTSQAFDVVSKVPSKKADRSNTKTVNSREVYERYGDNIVNSVCRDKLSQYTIHELMEKQGEISEALQDFVSKEFKERNLPLRVLEFNLGQLTPPPVIVTAQEKAKEREIKIKEAEADRLVQMQEVRTKFEVEQKEQEIDLLEAKTQFEVEKILSGSVNKAFVAQRSLKIMEMFAQSENKVILLPLEVMQDPAKMVGINQELFKE